MGYQIYSRTDPVQLLSFLVCRSWQNQEPWWTAQYGYIRTAYSNERHEARGKNMPGFAALSNLEAKSIVL